MGDQMRPQWVTKNIVMGRLQDDSRDRQSLVPPCENETDDHFSAVARLTGFAPSSALCRLEACSVVKLTVRLRPLVKALCLVKSGQWQFSSVDYLEALCLL